MTHHVVHRRLQVGVAESLDDYSVDVGDLPFNRLRAIDADYRPDPDGRIDRRPEMKLVRRVRLSLRRDDSTQRHVHEMALRNSSQSRTP